MKQGHNVLIWGASGGLGAYATQYALAGGAIPICVVSSEHKAELCRSMGAELIINRAAEGDRKSTRLNSSHRCISYAVFCLKKKTLIHNALTTVAMKGTSHAILAGTASSSSAGFQSNGEGLAAKMCSVVFSATHTITRSCAS